MAVWNVAVFVCKIGLGWQSVPVPISWDFTDQIGTRPSWKLIQSSAPRCLRAWKRGIWPRHVFEHKFGFVTISPRECLWHREDTEVESRWACFLGSIIYQEVSFTWSFGENSMLSVFLFVNTSLCPSAPWKRDSAPDQIATICAKMQFTQVTVGACHYLR